MRAGSIARLRQLVISHRASYVGSVKVTRISPKEFRRIPLEAHAFLSGVPLSDVTSVELPGGGRDRTLADVRRLMPNGPLRAGGSATRSLFALRSALGRLFGWDRAAQGDVAETYASRVPAELAARSVVPTGSDSGMFRVLYELPNESVVEARNRTVHAFLCSALVPVGAGYRLYWAVYVKPVSAFTRLYMAVIEPFRRFIVYPSVLGGVRRAWEGAYTVEPAA
jgi:hypothetical protein